ncbi:Agglutinin-like protein 1 precursor, partial [Ancistrocladus abbreviatus]
MIDTDALSKTYIVEVTRSITKHNYLVLDADDIPRIVEEAFLLANGVTCEELRKFVDLTGILLASTLMCLGSWVLALVRMSCQFQCWECMDCACNCGVDKNDLLLAFGLWLDDSVTGKLEAFARRMNIVHIDTDYVEIANVMLAMTLEMQFLEYAMLVLDARNAIGLVLGNSIWWVVICRVHSFEYKNPRAVGFGLPAAMGAEVGGAVAQPDAIVADID